MFTQHWIRRSGVRFAGAAALAGFAALASCAGAGSTTASERVAHTALASTLGCGASGANGMEYASGPLLTNPINIYYIWYGPVAAADQALAIDFANNVDTSAWWGIMQSYCDSTGTLVSTRVSFAGALQIDETEGKAETDANLIVLTILGSGGLPVDPNGVYVIFGAPGTVSAESPGASGFHKSLGVESEGQTVGVHLAWINGECSEGTQQGGPCQVEVLSHELAESATDPSPLSGWSNGSDEGEVADVCVPDVIDGGVGPTHVASWNGAPANEHLGSHDYVLQPIWVNGGGGYCALARSADEGRACASGSDCPNTGICTAGICQLANCTNGVRDGSETDIDCGGYCGPCARGQSCVTSADCLGASVDTSCFYGICGETCSNGIQDQRETDVDCGGPVCPKCADSKSCLRPGDCAGGSCANGYCEVASCSNGVHDELNDETDVDCGGSNCPPCPNRFACAQGTDCASGLCEGSVCIVASCTDGVLDGDETGVDCGGTDCAPCTSTQPSQGCRTKKDCAGRGPCVAGLCRAPTCSDGLFDGNEISIDCGGSCPACPGGTQCTKNTDCSSRVCLYRLCLTASCSDGFADGTETDVDCGGGSCPPCLNQKLCAANTDCQTGSVCNGGRCAASTCSNGVEDGTETDVDCGGNACPPCAVGKGCDIPSDCDPANGSACESFTCAVATCSDFEKDGLETDVDCGGGICPACSDRQACTQDRDCTSGSCAAGVCVGSGCTDGTRDGHETGIDCGGIDCAPCAPGGGCATSHDCAGRGACTGGVCNAPTCADGIFNGTETDRDCGGSSCSPCPLNTFCKVNADCQSSDCLYGVCTD
jgi:hypothetical protein